MKQRLLFLISVLCLTKNIFASSPTTYVVFDDTLKNSKFVGEVIIDKYDGKGNIYFHSIKHKDTINQAGCSNYTKEGLMGFPEIEYNGTKSIPDYLSGSYPNINDTVLIVISKTNRVSLFAKILKSEYRFWLPTTLPRKPLLDSQGDTQYLVDSGSGPLVFVFKKPATIIDKQHRVKGRKIYRYECYDGCILKKKFLKQYINKK